jgi:adenylylsulfate kinase
MVDAGLVVLASFISPFESDRNFVRELVTQDKFIEIYVKCDIDICKRRDNKGLYRKAIAGEITNFTGIDSKYEEPSNPSLIIDTTVDTVKVSVKKLFTYIRTVI